MGLRRGVHRSRVPFSSHVRPLVCGIRAKGVRNVPGHGRAMLVANHAGGSSLGRDDDRSCAAAQPPAAALPRFLVLNWAFELPTPRSCCARSAASRPRRTTPANCRGRPDRRGLPEGIKAPARIGPSATGCSGFGRGGYVELAIRTGRRSCRRGRRQRGDLPKLGENRLLARRTGAPYFPLTPLFPWLGPLGAIPLPSEVADRVLRADTYPSTTARSGERPAARPRALRARPETIQRSSTRPRRARVGVRVAVTVSAWASSRQRSFGR